MPLSYSSHAIVIQQSCHCHTAVMPLSYSTSCHCHTAVMPLSYSTSCHCHTSCTSIQNCSAHTQQHTSFALAHMCSCRARARHTLYPMLYPMLYPSACIAPLPCALCHALAPAQHTHHAQTRTQTQARAHILTWTPSPLHALTSALAASLWHSRHGFSVTHTRDDTGAPGGSRGEAVGCRV